MTHRAVRERKIAWLSGDWAYKVACEKFGQELVDSFPRYTRGPRKGKLKGALCWTKVTRGGWVATGPGYMGEGTQGYVERPGSRDWRLTLTPYFVHDHGVVARWYDERHASALGCPQVELVQTPEQAVEAAKHGDQPRYG